MHADPVALLPVTQADRDAVLAFQRTMLARLMSDVKSERPKLGDDEGDAGTLVQAFARHRLAHRTPAPAGDVAEEALRIAYKTGHSEGYTDATDDGTGNGYSDHDAAEEGWQQYREKLSAEAVHIDAPISADSVDDVPRNSSVVDGVRPVGGQLAVKRAHCGLPCGYDCNHPDGCIVTPDAAAMLAASTTPDSPVSGSAEVLREASLKDGEWFYPEGDHSSDECRFSHDEVIDYALEGESVSQVVAIERATSLPTVYAAVRVWTDAEKDERGSDDDYDYTLHATADAARAALTEGQQS